MSSASQRGRAFRVGRHGGSGSDGGRDHDRNGEGWGRGINGRREAGGRTIGQDEKTSTVYGMPKMAREIGAVEMEVPLGGIPSAILRKVKQLSP